MSQNLLFDPVKKDYVTKYGSPIPTDRVLESAYYAIQIPQYKWLYGDPTQGSLLYTLQGIKRTDSVEKDFASYTKDAIDRQLIQTGKATDSEIQNLQSTRTGTVNQINIVPSVTQLSNELNFIGV